MEEIYLFFLFLLYFENILYPKHIGVINFNKILVYTIIILEYTTFIFAHHKFVYLFNPYKRIKTAMTTSLAKCGKYLCFETKSKSRALLDYKNFTIKNIKLVDGEQNTFAFSCFPINDNIIIFSDILSKRCKVYDIKQDKIIKDYMNDFTVLRHKTSKVGDNLYYTFSDEYLYKWKYNFELNKVDILNKKNIKYLGKLSPNSEYIIINDKFSFFIN